MRSSGPARLLLVPLLAGLAGCPEPQRPKTFDPDGKSGPDAARANALRLPLDTPVTDFVSFRKGDRTDWKFIEVPPARRGSLGVKLRWDDTQSELMMAVFDGLGVEVIQGTPTDGQRKTVEWSIDPEQPRYYVRVTAPLDGYESSYSLLAKWTDTPAASTTTTTTTTTATTTVTPPPVTPEPEPEPEAKPDPSAWLQGRIVTTYREGDVLMIHLDKGSAAGVRAGTRGMILQGPSGNEPLPGGDFSVIRVVDASRCIAKSRVATVKGNLRVALDVAP